MIRRIVHAYQVEFAKSARQWTSLLGPALVLAAVIAAYFVRPIERDGESDYAFIAYTTPLTLNLLGFFVILLFSTSLVSNELASGTIRALVVQSLRRRELLFAKYLLALTYVLVIDAVAAAASWIGAATFGDLAGVRFGGELLFTHREMGTAYLLATALALLPQSAVVALGLLFSTCTKSTAVAATAAIGVWLLTETLKYPLNVEAYVFFTYLDWPWQVFADRCDAITTPWMPTARYAVGVSAASAVVFVSLAAVILARRDLAA